MRNILLVFQREYVERVRSKAFIILTVLMPLLFVAMFALPVLLMSKASKEQRVALVDLDGRVGSLIEQRLSAAPDKEIDPAKELQKQEKGRGAPSGFEDKYKIEHVTVAPGQEASIRAQLSDRLKNNKLDAYLWVDTNAVEKGRVDYYARNMADLGGLEAMHKAVSGAVTQVRLVGKGVPADQVSKLLKDVDLHTVQVSEKGEKENKGLAGFMLPYFFTMLLYMTLIIYGVSVMRSVIEEKNSRVFEVLLSSVRPVELMAGKIMGAAAVGFTQYIVWGVMFSVASAVGASSVPKDMGDFSVSPTLMFFFVVYFVLGYLLYSSLYGALGATVNSDQEGQQLSITVTMLLIIPIISMSMIMRDPDSPRAVVMSMIPFFSPILMFLRITVKQPPAWQIATSIGILMVTIAGAMWVCARIYRVGILMYGKRPTLPEIVRWIRTA